MSTTLGGLSFAPPVTHVYDPFDYARTPFHAYLQRYAQERKQAVWLGMNPGPFGMAQTGVPFGDVTMVRDFLGIDGSVGSPPSEHPKRPVRGFAIGRREVSGTRLWGAIAAHFGKADRFFTGQLVLNYCPLLFLEQSGRNRTPDKLPASEREPLFAVCDRWIATCLEALEPRTVVAIGVFAERRARTILAESMPAGTTIEVHRILHPSPASPAANRAWPQAVTRDLIDAGIWPAEVTSR